LARVSKTKLAEPDLDEIWFTIAIDNVDAADAWIDELESKTNMLAANPKLGRLRPELMAEMRSFPVGHYIVLYRPDPEEGIEVVRILHGMRDIEASFRDEA
jgi:toxin ParE1/3/4